MESQIEIEVSLPDKLVFCKSIKGKELVESLKISAFQAATNIDGSCSDYVLALTSGEVLKDFQKFALSHSNCQKAFANGNGLKLELLKVDAVNPFGGAMPDLKREKGLVSSRIRGFSEYNFAETDVDYSQVPAVMRESRVRAKWQKNVRKVMTLIKAGDPRFKAMIRDSKLKRAAEKRIAEAKKMESEKKVLPTVPVEMQAEFSIAAEVLAEMENTGDSELMAEIEKIPDPKPLGNENIADAEDEESKDEDEVAGKVEDSSAPPATDDTSIEAAKITVNVEVISADEEENVAAETLPASGTAKAGDTELPESVPEVQIGEKSEPAASTVADEQVIESKKDAADYSQVTPKENTVAADVVEAKDSVAQEEPKDQVGLKHAESGSLKRAETFGKTPNPPEPRHGLGLSKEDLEFAKQDSIQRMQTEVRFNPLHRSASVRSKSMRMSRPRSQTVRQGPKIDIVLALKSGVSINIKVLPEMKLSKFKSIATAKARHDLGLPPASRPFLAISSSKKTLEQIIESRGDCKLQELDYILECQLNREKPKFLLDMYHLSPMSSGANLRSPTADAASPSVTHKVTFASPLGANSIDDEEDDDELIGEDQLDDSVSAVPAGALSPEIEVRETLLAKLVPKIPLDVSVPGTRVHLGGHLKATSLQTVRDVKLSIFAEIAGQAAAMQAPAKKKKKNKRANVVSVAGLGMRESDFVLKIDESDRYLLDESVKMSSLEEFKCKVDSFAPLKVSIVSKLQIAESRPSNLSPQDILDVEMHSILGISLPHDDWSSDVRVFRNSVRKLFKEEIEDMDPVIKRNVTSIPKPDPVPPKFMVKIHLLGVGASTITKGIQVTPGARVSEIMALSLSKSIVKDRILSEGLDLDPENYIFKVVAQREYFQGDNAIIEYDYIRRCLASKRTVELCMVRREKLAAKTHLPEDDITPKPIEDLSGITDGAFSLWEIDLPFRVRIRGAENVPAKRTIGEGKEKDKKVVELNSESCSIYVTCGIYHGGELQTSMVMTKLVPAASNVRWYQWLETSLPYCGVTRNARVCFTMWSRFVDKNVDAASAQRPGVNSMAKAGDVPLGWVSCQLMDCVGRLRQGNTSMRMWPNREANPIGTCVENLVDTNSATLSIEFESFTQEVVFPRIQEGFSQASRRTAPPVMTDEHQDRLDALCAKDPLYHMTAEEKDMLWHFRESLITIPKALPKFLQAVQWNQKEDVVEAHSLLRRWAPVEPVDALELLDAKYADDVVREYAVRSSLENLPDMVLVNYVLQLVQALKFESYHNSSLGLFLLRRALWNPESIGHFFFWHLMAEMHNVEISERYGLLLESYLLGCRHHRRELLRQVLFVQELGKIAKEIQQTSSSDRPAVLQKGLEKVSVDFDGPIVLPISPKLEVNGLVVKKCRYMDSKKLPLWLEFKNSDPVATEPVRVMFKYGDDLRQDMLTLQLMRMMDSIWQRDGHNLCMNPYGAISTGNMEGFLEIVGNAQTISNIAGDAVAAFKKSTIDDWIRENNLIQSDYEKAVQKFLVSNVAYLLATYTLGIGDRHGDNIMITRKGELFHIDFGHFLGNFKSKFGIKRERSPFVFTPSFAYVLGGPKSEMFTKQFVPLVQECFNILRREAHLFITLFLMMLSTGIPELTSEEDIHYLRDMFYLAESDEQAAENIKKLLNGALGTVSKQIDEFIHIYKHKK